nr:peroxisomal membrane protein PEX13-like [Procambarus clarkii]
MASAPKPWERQNGVNQRQPNFNPDNANAFVSVSPHVAPGTGGGGGGFSHTSQPPLPPRPNSTRTSTFSRPSYGAYGSYGGAYSSLGGSYYGGGYNAYGATYGNYNRFGMMGGAVTDQGFMQAAEESSRQAFQSIESIVHAFGSVSMMLESTYHAVYSSFRAVLGVADHFSRMKSHFAQIFSALAVVRTLRWLYRKLLYLIGLRSQDPSLEAAWRNTGGLSEVSATAFTEADIKASKSSWPIVMFLAVVFGGPYVIWRLLSSLAPQPTKAKGWVRGQSEHYAALAQYSFQGESRNELSFRAGQSLFLAPRDQQPSVRGWLLASNGTNFGLVPANYVKILGLRSGSSLPGNSQMNQGDPAELMSRSRVVASGIPNMPAPKYMPPVSPGVSQAPTMPGTLPHTFGQQPQHIQSGQLPQESSLTSMKSPKSELSPVLFEERKIDTPDQQCTLTQDDAIEARLDAIRDNVETQESSI